MALVVTARPVIFLCSHKAVKRNKPGSLSAHMGLPCTWKSRACSHMFLLWPLELPLLPPEIKRSVENIEPNICCLYDLTLMGYTCRCSTKFGGQGGDDVEYNVDSIILILPNTKLPRNEELSLIMAPPINFFIFLVPFYFGFSLFSLFYILDCGPTY